MEAIIYKRYGGPEVLQLAQVDRPRPGRGEVLVRICAASINAADYRLMRANPFLARLHMGLLRPKSHILGADIAGVVTEVGPGVHTLRVGDQVFGDTFQDGLGGFAQFARVRASALVHKPRALSFEEAAAVPLAGITALQAVRDRAVLLPGQSVLIQGAGGGVGTLLVQLAKEAGAKVTAICGPGSQQLVRDLGADRTLDYTKDSLGPQRYDAIFGVNGYRPLAQYKALLSPGGVYVMIGGSTRQLYEALLLRPFHFAFTDKRCEVLTIDDRYRARDLAQLAELLNTDRLRPIIDRTFELAETSEAMRYVEQGHVRGKVILSMQREKNR